MGYGAGVVEVNKCFGLPLAAFPNLTNGHSSSQRTAAAVRQVLAGGAVQLFLGHSPMPTSGEHVRKPGAD